MPIGLTVGDKGKAAFGAGLVSGHPRAFGRGSKSAPGWAALRGFPRAFGYGQTGASSIYWASDFGTALGTDANATTDGGKWNGGNSGNHNVTGEGLEVVDASGIAGWPSPNALWVNSLNGASAIPRVGGLWSVPSVGESIFYRCYFHAINLVSDEFPNASEHPVQPDTGTQVAWLFQNRKESTSTAGKWDWCIYVGSTNSWRRWHPINHMDKGVTYRLEWGFDRLATNDWHLHMRVYSADDSILYDESDIRNYNNTATLDSQPTINLLNISTFDTLQAGINGISEAVTFPFSYAYEGAFAVGDSWIGPYVPGEAA